MEAKLGTVHVEEKELQFSFIGILKVVQMCYIDGTTVEK